LATPGKFTGTGAFDLIQHARGIVLENNILLSSVGACLTNRGFADVYVNAIWFFFKPASKQPAPVTVRDPKSSFFSHVPRESETFSVAVQSDSLVY
jgi:hypothetical protein